MKPMLLRALAAATMATVLGGCVGMAPHYQRPGAPVPVQFGNAATGEADPALAMPAWREVFLEPRLQQVIDQSLQNNRDLRVAVLNVERARGQYRVQRAGRVPGVAVTGQMERRGTDAGVTEQ
ncbi:TolC family protein, partial [Klebsiella pneumoniae]|uniref:TolC family protein n=1 Tax=Klebsiella pneumoniae TaxID=573 RepID=UPI003D35D3D2